MLCKCSNIFNKDGFFCISHYKQIYKLGIINKCNLACFANVLIFSTRMDFLAFLFKYKKAPLHAGMLVTRGGEDPRLSGATPECWLLVVVGTSASVKFSKTPCYH